MSTCLKAVLTVMSANAEFAKLSTSMVPILFTMGAATAGHAKVESEKNRNIFSVNFFAEKFHGPAFIAYS